jgi:transcription antitermination protein NusB
MTISRGEARKLIMTVLYQVSLFSKNKLAFDINDIIDNVVESKNDFIIDIVNGVINYQAEIDDIANKYLNDWNIDRLGPVDQSILRMGIYEIIHTDTPDIVCINEAIELAKIYSDDAVRKMINGVLDKVYHNKK